MASQIARPIILFSILLLSLHKTNGNTSHGEQMTHLRVYFHETFTGPKATLVNVIQAAKNNSAFGRVGVIDDLLLEGADPNSKLIGRAQGLVVGASMEEDNGLLTTLNFVFTDGPYNGSTLAIFGRVVLGTVIERTVIGGTGQFRMARGYSIGKFLSSAPNTLIIEFDSYVWHH
ncbi:hypothetical protein LUZ60_004729 [Juncus effusus]|nr:hypothetical protein LUZ60_004729 [Juncus effusus]